MPDHIYRGLSEQEVLDSREQFGLNILTPPRKESLLKRFLAKFKDPLITILLIAGILSICIACYEYWGLGSNQSVFFEPVGIFIAIFLATGLAFIFELKADREFAILNKVNDDDPVQVIRGGMVTGIPRKDVVKGDIVILNTGDEVPADGILLESTSLSVDESTLTGEPVCHKTTVETDFDPEATFPSDHVMRGTKIMEGHGIFRVTAVGDATENGKVFEASQIDDRVKTPLDEQLGRLGKMISTISYVIGSLVIAGRIIMYFLNTDFDIVGFLTYFLQSVMIAVTLIVVSVPEGLPMAVTLSLAYSMRRMLKTNNLVRKMHACETMGATTVICTDKTGTLTENQMRVYQTVFYPLPESMSFLIEEGIAVNSTAQLDLTDQSRPTVLGNPTEGALLLWLRDNGTDYLDLRGKTKIIEELPFSTERKYMATSVRNVDGREFLFVKGAPEIIYSLCEEFPESADKVSVDRQLSEYQNQAMRTLGFAAAQLQAGDTGISDGRVTAGNLRFLGFAAISDPVRPDVPSAVKEVIDAGVKVKIVTGDTPGTAKEIGRQIGLWDDRRDSDKEIITGADFAAMNDNELRRRVKDLKIISRARPMDKKRLVEALQANNEVVAVTGDGTNDAPALKSAHVGLSMGDGTSVAKEASDITIVNNSFSSIGRAVMWGRSLYKNIQRFVLFQMTVNVAACLIVLAGSFMGTDAPLTVTQMLWVNLIMDTFAAMALAALPPSESVMREKPRDRNSFIINRSMWHNIIGTGSIFFVMLFSLLWIFEKYDIAALTDIFKFHEGGYDGLTPYELSLFFTIFVFLQFWNMFNARAFASNCAGFDLKNCGEFKFIALVVFTGQILIVSFGGQFFNVVPLHITDWIAIIGITSLVLLTGDIARGIRRHNNLIRQGS